MAILTAHLPSVQVVVRFKTLTKSHLVKGIDNAFDHIELCLVLQAVK